MGLLTHRRIAQHPKLAHAAFLLETPQDETGDDARNLEALRSFVKAINQSQVGKPKTRARK